MRLYKITYETDVSIGDSEFEKRTTWHGTNADCVARRKVLKEDGVRQKDIETVEVDVPTDKAGLLAFLNQMSAA